MSKKLMTLRELSEYLRVSEEKISELVEKKVIIAYKIGGELLRFRKEQIDATLSEINSRVEENDRLDKGGDHSVKKERLRVVDRSSRGNTFYDRLVDFFYFNDFYLFSAVLVIVLLIVIFKY